MVPCKSTAQEVLFEWAHHKISSTDSKVRTVLHVSLFDSGRERGKWRSTVDQECSGGKCTLLKGLLLFFLEMNHTCSTLIDVLKLFWNS